ncbi:hypothetical protein BCR42DRAFT_424593 [Absidia repens]|uniref:Uncharacterized protein n=1 Tax=Absidia repens TaxID=90262 RepID=A0A1X2I3U9_9FUNG|nr:hypothetical protein BCR42DRAFT_424593 [Absidia repens]
MISMCSNTALTFFFLNNILIVVFNSDTYGHSLLFRFFCYFVVWRAANKICA